MLAKLLDQGSAAGQRQEIAITQEEFLVGRGDDCDLRLSAAAISRHHCLFRIRGGESTLADLGSANGTFVNGRRILSQTTLQHGDVIGLGEFQFLLELESPSGSGIQWGPESGESPEAPTLRVKSRKEAPGDSAGFKG